MPSHRLFTHRPLREALFDGATLALAGALVLLAATGLNRLPYPGDQRYAQRAVTILSAPVSSLSGDLLPDMFVAPAADDAGELGE